MYSEKYFLKGPCHEMLILQYDMELYHSGRLKNKQQNRWKIEHNMFQNSKKEEKNPELEEEGV